MTKWEIKVLYLGKITANLSMIWPNGMPPLQDDPELSAPYLGFLLQSQGRNILVDSGISENFIVDGMAWGLLPAEGGSTFIKSALEKEGLDPEDIDTVIFTHLHNDHAANCGLFKNAKLIFQKEEWLNLLSPLPVQNIRMDYDPGLVDEIKTMSRLAVDGDFEITDGIKLYKTPGHSLGSQSVAVNTEGGVRVLVGDLCLFNFMMFPGTTEMMDMQGNKFAIPPAPEVFGPAVPHSIIYDYYAFYDSIQKVKAIAEKDEPGFIIPGHEPSLLVNGV